MGAGASAPDPANVPKTREEALKTYTAAQIDAYETEQKAKAESAPAAAAPAVATPDSAAAAPAVTTEAAAATVMPAAAAAETASAAPAAAAGGVDRSGITRNSNGSEEPSSADPELWNVDGAEVDYLVKYKMGGQMWYVQSRMRENPPKGKPIPGFPMNEKAKGAKRFHVAADESEQHADNDKATHWNKEWQQPPAA